MLNMRMHLIFTFLLRVQRAVVALKIFMIAPGAVSANSCCLCVCVCVSVCMCVCVCVYLRVRRGVHLHLGSGSVAEVDAVKHQE